MLFGCCEFVVSMEFIKGYSFSFRLNRKHHNKKDTEKYSVQCPVRLACINLHKFENRLEKSSWCKTYALSGREKFNLLKKREFKITRGSSRSRVSCFRLQEDVTVGRNRWFSRTRRKFTFLPSLNRKTNSIFPFCQTLRKIIFAPPPFSHKCLHFYLMHKITFAYVPRQLV